MQRPNVRALRTRIHTSLFTPTSISFICVCFRSASLAALSAAFSAALFSAAAALSVALSAARLSAAAALSAALASAASSLWMHLSMTLRICREGERSGREEVYSSALVAPWISRRM